MTSVAEKPVKAKRKAWTQAEVASLVRSLNTDVPDTWALNHTRDEAEAKLIELGIISKPAKPELSEIERDILKNAIVDMLYEEDPTRTLQIRYAIKSLQALLPKREPRS